MKRILNILLVTVIIIAGSSVRAHAQNGRGKAQRTSGAQAAYGGSVSFKSHVKKNKMARLKALKSAKRKKLKDTKEPYRRGIPI